MKKVASIILGGGEGTRLFPLTLTRCKPAIRFGGKYRLIDVPLSLSIHANCFKIFVLTQFLSSSLHHHIFQTYMQGGRASNLIEILTAEQRPSQKNWYQGTADAVRQNLNYLLEMPVDYFLILSGDQLYDISFQKMLQFALETDADAIIAALPVDAQDATRMGILKLDENNFITTFHEKPQDPALLRKLQTPSRVIEKAGILPSSKRRYLGSMGIYLFKRKILADILRQDTREDFGKHLIPSLVEKGNVAAFLHDGYWEDIGTIETFYKANIALTESHPPFCLYNQERPILTSLHDLPPATLLNTQMKQAILSEGSIIEAEAISHSIIGARTVVHKGAIIRDSYLMGNDYYEAPVNDHPQLPTRPHIGENSIITRAIIDKNVVIGKGVQLINKQNLLHFDGGNIFIRDGIIIVPQGAVIPDGYTL